jgi:hypothetical protein
MKEVAMAELTKLESKTGRGIGHATAAHGQDHPATLEEG